MKFTAFERNLQGTGASRRLRMSGKVPGIVFGAGEPAKIELDLGRLACTKNNAGHLAAIAQAAARSGPLQIALESGEFHGCSM